MSELPPIPDGFVLKQQIPPLPPGFVLQEGQIIGDDSMPALPDGTEQYHMPKGSVLRDAKRLAKDVAKDLAAVGELGLTTATSGLGAISGGALAAFGSLMGQSPESAAETVEYVTDLITIEPHTERGKKLIEDVAAPLMKLEEGADDLAFWLSKENPFAASLIKTSLLGAIEVASPTKTGVKSAKLHRLIDKRGKEIVQAAIDMNIPLDAENLKTGVVDAARKMTPAERAENMPMLVDAMREAEAIAKQKRTDAYDRAKATRTYINTRNVRDLSMDIRAQLIERGYDLEMMPIVNKRLKDLDADTKTAKARLGEFEKVRKRINANRSQSPSENSALNHIRREMDAFLDNEFNKIALGEDSAISGDASGVQAWKDARLANMEWQRNFSEDKAISQLIEMEATPEQYRQWLMGATAMNARKQASATIERIRSVLGDQHPAIEGIRQDFLFEIAEPLLKKDPDFAQFTKNYDTFIRRNPSLVKSLGLDEGNLRQLNEFAELQQRLPEKPMMDRRDLSKSLIANLSRFFVGHKLARGQVRIGVARSIGNFVIGVDRVSQKQILAELVNAKYGEVAIPKNSLIAAQFITGAALTALPKESEIMFETELEEE